jgi:phosphatidylserine decarboxylase
LIKYFQILLAKLVGWMAFAKLPPQLLRWFIRLYIKYYKISLDDFDYNEKEISCFNDFFTRKLKPNVRPLGKDIVSPVDACVYAVGEIHNGQIFQIKDQEITVEGLLDADRFIADYFMSFYLSPADYHRFHAPVDLKVTSIEYIPGMFYSVRPKIAKKRKVFLKNERVVLDCETAHGKLYLVFVAAQNVGKIELKALGGTCPGKKAITLFDEFQQSEFQKGDELGVFHMGSSVVMLTENTPLKSVENYPIKMGESIEEKSHNGNK